MNFKSLSATVVGLALLVTPTVTPAPASAEAVGGNVPGQANADSGWNWEHSSIRNIYIGVDDLLCDSKGAYAYLRVYQPSTDAGYKDIARVEDACKGGPTYRRGLNFDGRSYISGVRLVVCVDSFGSDTCDRNHFVKNPVPK